MVLSTPTRRSGARSGGPSIPPARATHGIPAGLNVVGQSPARDIFSAPITRPLADPTERSSLPAPAPAPAAAAAATPVLLSPGPAPMHVPAPAPEARVVEKEYIANLQQQIYFLELELSFLKKKGAKKSHPGAGAGTGTAAPPSGSLSAAAPAATAGRELLEQQQRCAQLESEKENLEAQITESGQEKEDLIGECVELRRKLDNARRTAREYKQRAARVGADLKGIAEARANDRTALQAAADSVAERDATIRRLNQRLAEQGESLVAARQKLARFEDDPDSKRLRDASDALRSENVDLRATVRQIESEQKVQHEAQKKLEQELRAAIKDSIALRDELGTAKSNPSGPSGSGEAVALRQRIDELEAREREQQAEMAALKQKNERLHTALGQEARRNEDLIEQMDEMRLDAGQSSAMAKDIDRRNRELAQENRLLKADKTRSEREIARLGDKVAATVKEMAAMRADLEQLRASERVVALMEKMGADSIDQLASANRDLARNLDALAGGARSDSSARPRSHQRHGSRSSSRRSSRSSSRPRSRPPSVREPEREPEREPPVAEPSVRPAPYYAETTDDGLGEDLDDGAGVGSLHSHSDRASVDVVGGDRPYRDDDDLLFHARARPASDNGLDDHPRGNEHASNPLVASIDRRGVPEHQQPFTPWEAYDRGSDDAPGPGDDHEDKPLEDPSSSSSSLPSSRGSGRSGRSGSGTA